MALKLWPTGIQRLPQKVWQKRPKLLRTPPTFRPKRSNGNAKKINVRPRVQQIQYDSLATRIEALETYLRDWVTDAAVEGHWDRILEKRHITEDLQELNTTHTRFARRLEELRREVNVLENEVAALKSQQRIHGWNMPGDEVLDRLRGESRGGPFNPAAGSSGQAGNEAAGGPRWR